MKNYFLSSILITLAVCLFAIKAILEVLDRVDRDYKLLYQSDLYNTVMYLLVILSIVAFFIQKKDKS